MPQAHIGGSFAPPLSDEKLASYATLIASMPPSAERDACALLMTCCEKWWNLPEPAGTAARAHPSGVGTIIALQDDHKAELDPHIPWGHELAAIQALFDQLPTGTTEQPPTHKPRHVVTDALAHNIRNMAFHLLWHVRELDLDREPLTADKLRG